MLRIFYLFICIYLCCSCSSTKWVVAKDGSSRYSTIQAALDAVPEGNANGIVISIKPGVYKEVLTIDSRKSNVTLKGSGSKNTIITFDLS